MFVKQPTIHRHTLHYKVWRWTFRNLLWKKRVVENKSLCQYWWRTILGGIITAILHILYGPLKILLYNILYQAVRPIFRNDVAAAFVVWLLLLFLVNISGAWVFLPWILGFILHCAGLIGLVFLIILVLKKFSETEIIDHFSGWVLKWLLKPVGLVFVFIFKIVLWNLFKFLFGCLPVFTVQVIEKFYIPRHELPDGEYKFRQQNQTLVKLSFWTLQFIFLASILVAILKTGITLPLLTAREIITSALILTVSILVPWTYAYFGLKRMEREWIYSHHPELRPKKKFAQLKARIATNIDHNKQPFLDWLKAIKEKVCPMVKFVD